MTREVARGPSTRSVHVGLPGAERGDPLLPGPFMAAPTHWAGAAGPGGYGRYGNPTWAALESAIGTLDGGICTVFASGMAAGAAILDRLRPGEVLVMPDDGYFALRAHAVDHLGARGVDVRLVPTDTGAVCAAAAGASLVWVETPSNPRLDVVDVRACAEAAHAAGALLAVDNTVATPLGLQPLGLGADIAMTSGTKSLSGHSDLLLGAVSVRDGALAQELVSTRTRTGGILGPVEAWLAHRSLGTLALRLERSSANALALAEMLRGRDDVLEVVHPADHAPAREQMAFYGPLVGFALRDEATAQAFLARCELVAEATSFGGVHSTAERRGRWGTDAVPDGFVRFSAGIEDTADLLADVEQALGG